MRSSAVSINNEWCCNDVCSFVTAPYQEGWKKIQTALFCFQGETIAGPASYERAPEMSLARRICLFAEGLLLSIPVIGTIVHVALRCLIKPSRTVPAAEQSPQTPPCFHREYPASTQSSHPRIDSFKDSAILKVHSPTRTATLSDGRTVAFTQSFDATERAVLLAKTNRSHPNQTCLAMLMLDRGVTPDVTELDIDGAPAYPAGREMLKKAGLEEVRRFMRDCEAPPEEQLRQLKRDVESHGPVMVDLWWRDPHRFNLFVIVDAISADLQKIRLRDPQHGWDITIKAEAFLPPYLAGGTDIKGIKEISHRTRNFFALTSI